MTTPTRTCVVCRTTKPKESLTRWVLDGSGELILDADQIMPGRAIYTCSDICTKQLSDKHIKQLTKGKNVRAV